jgi:hypothetical protein
MFYNEVIAVLMQYLVTRDQACLNSAIAKIEAERENPSLCDCQITVKYRTLEEVTEDITNEGSLKIRIDTPAIEYVGDPVENKFVRVKTRDQEEDTCLILRVTYMHDGLLVLVPVMPL